jgi:molecular chaperone GrpE (heat shock protein)
MSDSNQSNPPKGDFEKAEKYINQLVELLNQKRVEVFHTDLKKFDPTTLQDHYTIKLEDYQIEISHSKQPNTGKDSYVMIFNNFKNLTDGKGEKAILAYVYLADSHFSKFKIVADRQIEDRRRAEEEKRFKEAMTPIDSLLDQALASTKPEHTPTAPSQTSQHLGNLLNTLD